MSIWQKKLLLSIVTLLISITIMTCGGEKKESKISPESIKVTSSYSGVDIYPPNCSSIKKYDYKRNIHNQPIGFTEDACGYTVYVSCIEYNNLGLPIFCKFSIESSGEFYAIANFNDLAEISSWTVNKGNPACPSEN